MDVLYPCNEYDSRNKAMCFKTGFAVQLSVNNFLIGEGGMWGSWHPRYCDTSFLLSTEIGLACLFGWAAVVGPFSICGDDPYPHTGSAGCKLQPDKVLDFVALCAESSMVGGAERFNERRRLVCISGGLWYLMSLTLLSQGRNGYYEGSDAEHEYACSRLVLRERALCIRTLHNGYYSHYQPVDGPEFETELHREMWDYWKQLPRESGEYVLWPLYGYDASPPEVIDTYLRAYATNSSRRAA